MTQISPADLKLMSSIPAEYRKAILTKNLIVKAQAVATNEEMYELMVYWKDYIEPHLDPTCNSCYLRVLDNYRHFQPALIQLEKEANLLNEV